MTNEQTVAQIRAGEDEGQGMASLYEQMKAFIHSIARKYQGYGVDLEDLEQEGFLGLYDAVAGYDPDREVKFLTYAAEWIRQRIVRYIQDNRSSLRIPVHAQEKQTAFRRFCTSFQMEHGQKPSEAEIAACLGLTLEQVRERKKNACMAALASLDSPVTGMDGDEKTALYEFIPSAGSMAEDAEEKVQHEQLCRVLWECVDSLPGRQAEVIRHKYQGGEALRQIGEALGVTADIVRQQERKALQELRKPLYADRLRPFLPDAERIYNEALKGNGVGRFNHTWTSSTERIALQRSDRRE